MNEFICYRINFSPNETKPTASQMKAAILWADRLTAELSREAQCFSTYDEKLQFMLQEDKRIVASWGHNWAKWISIRIQSYTSQVLTLNIVPRGRSQTTFTNFANFWPPTYLCLHWLTFELPPTYLSTLTCDKFLPYIDMYLVLLTK